MPFYEYNCKKCSAQFELLIRGKLDQATASCPDCGSTQIEKLFSVFGMSGVENRASAPSPPVSCSTRSNRKCSCCH